MGIVVADHGLVIEPGEGSIQRSAFIIKLVDLIFEPGSFLVTLYGLVTEPSGFVDTLYERVAGRCGLFTALCPFHLALPFLDRNAPKDGKPVDK